MEPIEGNLDRDGSRRHVDPRRRRALGVFTISVACVGAATAFLNGSFLGAAQSAVAVEAPVVTVPVRSEPVVVHVPGEHATIQHAIDAASDGDTILIGPGLYQERLRLDGRFLHLLGVGGASATQVVADAPGKPVVWIRGGSNRIEGITFEGGQGEGGRGAVMQRGSAVFVSCRFTRNAGGAEATDAQVRFEGCWFNGNRASFAGGGVLARRSELHMDRCHVESNVATTFGGGVGLMDGEAVLVDTTVSGNRLASGAWGGGLYGDNARLLVERGVFEGNVSAESGPAAFLTGGAGTFRGVRFDDNRSEGGWVVHGSHGVSLTLERVEGETGPVLTSGNEAWTDEVAMADAVPPVAGTH